MLWRDNKFRSLGSIWVMKRFVRIGLATIAAVVGVGLIEHALGLQEFAGGLGDIGFLIATMLLASLSDRELFWAIPPKRERRR